MNIPVESIYKKIGEALHLGQTLEFSTRTLISVLNDNFDSKIDIDGLIVKSDKKTLGRLIGELKKHAKIDESGCEILESALNIRNYIAHDYFIKNNALFSDVEYRAHAMNKLESDVKSLATGTAIMMGFLEGFCSSLNIDLSTILVQQSM